VDKTSREILVQDSIVAKLSEDGEIDVQLQVTDEGVFQPSDWSWTVEERVTGLTARRYDLDLPDSTEPFNLAAVDSSTATTIGN
jgi:hypothetical protein